MDEVHNIDEVTLSLLSVSIQMSIIFKDWRIKAVED